MFKIRARFLPTGLLSVSALLAPLLSQAQSTLRIEQFRQLPDGKAELVLTGVTEPLYTIEATTNLVHWIKQDEQAPQDLGDETSALTIFLNGDWPHTFYRVSHETAIDEVGLDFAGTIGPAGGQISAQQGRVVLDFSPGAVLEDMDIRVSPLANVGVPGVIPSTVVDFGPDGAEFSAPVTLTLSYAEAGLPAEFDATALVIVSSSLVSGELTPVAGSTVDTVAQTISATVSGFSTFAAALPNCTFEGNPQFPWCPARCFEPPPPSPDDPGGDLDLSFGTDGVFSFELGLAGVAGLDDLLIDDQGRLLLAVEMTRMGVARVLPDGEGFDTDFGKGIGSGFGTPGIAQLSFSEYDNTPRSVKLRTDGRILLYGMRQTSPPYTQIARFMPDGVLDTSFGENGVTLDTREANYLQGYLATLPDGRMLVTDPNGRNLYQFLADGSPDPNFGVDGIANNPLFTGGPILRRATGDWLLGRGKDILEVDAQGNPGRLFSSQLELNYTAIGFQEIPGGSYVQGGSLFSRDGLDFVWTPFAARFQPGDEPGSLEPDICFGKDEFAIGFGLRTYNFGDSHQVTGMAVQADGRILLAGSTNNRGADDDAFVIRIRPDGEIDAGFGENGIVYLDFGGDEADGSVAIDSQGRIVFAGSSASSGDRIGVIARLLP